MKKYFEFGLLDLNDLKIKNKLKIIRQPPIYLDEKAMTKEINPIITLILPDLFVMLCVE